VTNVHVDKVVYKNVTINNAVTTVNHDTFVRGKPADDRVKENPFLTEKIHVGRPPINPEKTSVMAVVREVPQTKRPPEPVRQVNVKELKERRPLVKSKETSVFTPETRPREMPVKQGEEAKPITTRTERAKELRQPSSRVGGPAPSVQAEKQVGQPGPSETKVGTPKERGKSEKTLEKARQPGPTPTKVQEQKQQVPADKGSGQPAPSGHAVRTPREMGTPERGTGKRMESRSPEKVIEQNRTPERVQPKSKEVSPPEKVIPQAPEPRTPDTRTERSRGDQGARRKALERLSIVISWPSTDHFP